MHIVRRMKAHENGQKPGQEFKILFAFSSTSHRLDTLGRIRLFGEHFCGRFRLKAYVTSLNRLGMERFMLKLSRRFIAKSSQKVTLNSSVATRVINQTTKKLLCHI